MAIGYIITISLIVLMIAFDVMQTIRKKKVKKENELQKQVVDIDSLILKERSER